MMRSAPPTSPLRGVLATLAALTATALATPAAHAEETAPADAAHPMATTSSGSLLNISSAPFGDTGQMVYSIANENDFPFAYSKDSGGGPWQFRLRPALDYFIKQSVSVGGMVRIETGGGTSLIGLGLRAGYNVPLSSLVSLWVRGGLSYSHRSVSNGPSQSITQLDILFPFLFHLVPHLFIGVGPFFSLPLTDSRAMANKNPGYGLTAIVGGYF